MGAIAVGAVSRRPAASLGGRSYSPTDKNLNGSPFREDDHVQRVRVTT